MTSNLVLLVLSHSGIFDLCLRQMGYGGVGQHAISPQALYYLT